MTTFFEPRSKIWRIIPMVVFGVWFSFKLYSSAQTDFFLDGFVFLFIGIVGSVFYIWTIYKDRKEFRSSHKTSSFLPTTIGTLLILINIGLFCYQDNRMNAPTLIKGFYDGGFNGFTIDFKKNGNYVMANGSGLGQSYFYGTYTIHDSIITLDKSNIDNCIKTNKLVIRTENYFQENRSSSVKSDANYITQINNGIESESDFRLRVVVDNRN